MKKVYESFNSRIKKPLDNRSTVNSLSDIDRPYEGMITHQESDKKFYKYKNGAYVDLFEDVLNKVSQKDDFVINVKYYGAKGDGITDDTTSIQSAIDYVNTQGGGIVFFPKGLYIVSGLTIYDNIQITGCGRKNTTIKLKNNSNADVITGYLSSTLWGTSGQGLLHYSIRDIEIDGNRSNNTSGSGIAIFAQNPEIINVSIKNCAEYGLRTEWSGLQPINDYGMEGYFSNIMIFNVGKHGFWHKGTNDSTILGVIVYDASQLANNTYDAFNLQGNGTGRFIACHSWNSNDIANRHRYAINIETDGNDFIGCHFEGAISGNVRLKGHHNIFTNCKFYASWNGVNVIVKGTENLMSGCSLISPISTKPPCKGIILGESEDYVTSNKFDLYANEQQLGIVDFTNSKGFNTVKISGFNSAGKMYEGTPHVDDYVEMIVTGAGGGKYISSSQKVSKVMTATHDAQTTGTQSIGVGYKPSIVEISASIYNTKLSSNGFSDGTTTQSTFTYGATGTFVTDGTSVVDLEDGSGNYIKASITFTDTGFNLVWTKNGTTITGSIGMIIKVN